MLVDLDVDFESNNFPPEAEVWLEAHVGSTKYKQFQWGTVQVPKPPADKELTYFNSSDNLQFRLNVVDPLKAKKKLILGSVDRLRTFKPSEKGKRKSLITTYGKKLDQKIWELNFEEQGEPALYINLDVYPSWENLAQDPKFIGLIYPEIFSQVLRTILETSKNRDIDIGSEDWESQWIRFAKIKGADWPLNDSSPESQEDWIREVVGSLCREFQFMDKFNSTEGAE
ncbi:MAG: hypothetical protein ACN6I3_00430 [bacterium]